MHSLSGSYATENAKKYLQQLCKHFGHKIDVSYDENQGTAKFIFGPAFFSADDQKLSVQFELNQAASVDAAKHVIDSHLKKFAFRESFENMEWQSDHS